MTATAHPIEPTSPATVPGEGQRLPTASRMAGSGAKGAPALRGEFDRIWQRLHDANARRAAILDLCLQQKRVLGAAWFSTGQDGPQPLQMRLHGPTVDRNSIRDWLRDVASRVALPGGQLEVESAELRNLSALAIAVPSAASPPDVLILLVAGHPVQRCRDEWLMLQQLAVAGESAIWAGVARTAEAQTRHAAALLELNGRLNVTDSFRAAAQELVRSVQQHLGCTLVAFGHCPPGSAVPRLVASSDGVDRASQAAQVDRLEAALGEAALTRDVVCFPAPVQQSSAPSLAHKRLAGLVSAEAVVSIPLLTAEGTSMGALLCAGTLGSLMNDQARGFLSGASRGLAPALAASLRGEGGKLSRLARGLSRGVTRARIVIAVGLVCLLVGLLALPLPYRISAASRLEPTSRRLSPAPFEGLLQTTHVSPGDLVVAGQSLATMDGREIRWELAGVVADQQRALKERDTHLAAHEIAQADLAALEAERLAARETLLRDRLDRLEIRSPSTGVVLSGSLDQRENLPVKAGQPLYEIAPLDQLRLELAIPAEEISHVEPGMTVNVRMDGVGGFLLTGEIERIRSSSEIRDGRNIFVAELTVPNLDKSLRPGMEGSARVTSASHPLGWNLFHRPWEWVRSSW